MSSKVARELSGVLGAGIDVVALSRVEALWLKQGARFVARVAGKDADADGNWTAPKLARRWALKEAVAKALGTGIGGSKGFKDIVVSHDRKGAPQVAVAGVAGVWRVSVSDDEAAGVAIAMALLVAE